eukprot:gene14791-biopygen3651
MGAHDGGEAPPIRIRRLPAATVDGLWAHMMAGRLLPLGFDSSTPSGDHGRPMGAHDGGGAPPIRIRRLPAATVDGLWAHMMAGRLLPLGFDSSTRSSDRGRPMGAHDGGEAPPIRIRRLAAATMDGLWAHTFGEPVRVCSRISLDVPQNVLWGGPNPLPPKWDESRGFL